MTAPNDGTGEGLLGFLDWAGRTGEMNKGTANAWAAAVRQVLAIDNVDFSEIDVRKLDVDAHFERFKNLNRTEYTSASMATYRSRFRKSVSAYLAWLNNEPWKPGKRAPSSGSASGSVTWTGRAKGKMPEVKEAQTSSPQPASTTQMMNYTLPLRRNLVISLSLPIDLTTTDAARIATFVRSVAFDHEPSSQQATSTKSDGGE